MIVHKLKLSVTFYKLDGYFHMYNRIKLRGITDYTSENVNTN